MFKIFQEKQDKLKNDKFIISIDTDTDCYVFTHISKPETEDELLEKVIDCDEYEDFEQQVLTYLRGL